MGKEGQVSIFIFVGVLILFLIGIGVYLLVNRADPGLIVFSPSTPVERYMSQCVQDVAKEGIILQGMQGGYTTLPANYAQPRTYIQELDGGVKVPLWNINGQNVVPDIRVLEAQLEQYVEEKLPACAETLYNVEGVTGVSFEGTPKASVSITRDDVVVAVNYSMKVTEDTRIQNFKTFGAHVPISLNHILETANFMLAQHNQDLFLDRVTLNTISLDTDIPIGDIRFTCEKLRWSKSAVKQQLQDDMAALLPLVRIKGSNHLPFDEPLLVYERIAQTWDITRLEREGLPDDLRDIYEYMQQYWEVDDYDFSNYNVAFSYFPSYGMRMEVSPSNGDRLSADAARSGSEFLKYMCINIYHFTYDVEYPVKVSIYDDSAFDGEGFVFNFAVPVQIQNNIPQRATPWFGVADAVETNDAFCNETTGEDVYINVEDPYASDFNVLSGVNVTYDCLKYYCPLGVTSTESNPVFPEIKTQLPEACANGFFIAEKEGYLRTKTQIVDPNGVVELTMVPLAKRNLVVATLTDSPYGEPYEASVYLKAKHHDYETFASWPAVNGVAYVELIRAPETYEYELTLMANGNLVGGYIGNLTVTEADLQQGTLYVYPKEWVDLVRGATDEQTLALYTYLDEDPDGYRIQYAPEFK